MRILFKIIFALIILAIVAIVALPFVIDPNDYKQEISDQVEKATGRTLQIDGDIQLSVFPWVALELGPLSLSNAKGFKSETFAQVKETQIRIKLMPLLSKQLEMDTVVLDGLTLNLETNKAGTTNWDDLAGKSDKEDTTSSDDDAPALAAISIAGVKLTNANIIWDDATTSEHYQLENLNLTTDPLVPGEPTAIDIDFNLVSIKPKAKAHISAQAKVTVDLDKQQYALTDLNFNTQAEGQNLPFAKADITLTGDVNADMVKKLISVKDLNLALKANADSKEAAFSTADIALKGDVNANLGSQLVTINGLSLDVKANKGEQIIDAQLTSELSSNLANQQSSLKGFKLIADITDPTLPGGKTKLSLNADISADMKKQTAALSNLALNVLDLALSGKVSLSKLLSENPNYAGTLNVKAFNLRQLANKLTIELPAMADSSTLELIQLNTEFTGSSKSFNAKKLDLTLDQSKLKGHFAINNFVAPAYDFKLTLDNIDADRYLPPAAKEGKKSAPPASTAAAGATQLPLETLRQINAKGSIDIGKLKISGLHSQKIHLQINAAKGLVKLSPLSANLYKGQYKGNVTLDARGKILKLAVNENLSGVQAGPLLKDLSGDDKLSGTANVQAKLTGNGATVDQIKSTLTGNGKFSFIDGAIKGVNIADSIRKAKAAFKNKKAPASKGEVKTDFASLSGSFTAKNGTINNQDFKAMSPLLRIMGAGKIDLPKEGINYGLKVSIVETSTGQAGKDLADLKGLTIPVKITGTFDNPKPTVDLAALLKNNIKAKAKEKIKAKVADKLKDKLGGKAGGLIDGLLGTEPAPTSDKAVSGSAPKAKEPAKSVEDQAKDALKDKLKKFF